MEKRKRRSEERIFFFLIYGACVTQVEKENSSLRKILRKGCSFKKSWCRDFTSIYSRMDTSRLCRKKKRINEKKKWINKKQTEVNLCQDLKKICTRSYFLFTIIYIYQCHSTTASEHDTGIDMLHNRSESELIGKSLNSFVFVFFKGVIFSFVVV